MGPNVRLGGAVFKASDTPDSFCGTMQATGDAIDAGAACAARDGRPLVAVIDKRTFVRECLSRSIRETLGHPVISFPDIAAWRDAAVHESVGAVLVTEDYGTGDGGNVDDIRALCGDKSAPPVVVLSDVNDRPHIAANLMNGARGHVPTNSPTNVVVEALRFAMLGGVFVPAECFLNSQALEGEIPLHAGESRDLTLRERAVVALVSQGKANKNIAFDLGMSESTVKVHLRNIMKKMKAKNRTEVATRCTGRATGGYIDPANAP